MSPARHPGGSYQLNCTARENRPRWESAVDREASRDCGHYGCCWRHSAVGREATQTVTGRATGGRQRHQWSATAWVSPSWRTPSLNGQRAPSGGWSESFAPKRLEIAGDRTWLCVHSFGESSTRDTGPGAPVDGFLFSNAVTWVVTAVLAVPYLPAALTRQRSAQHIGHMRVGTSSTWAANTIPWPGR